MLEYLAEETWEWGALPLIVMLIGCVAAAGALWLSRVGRAPAHRVNWLATRGLIAPFVALAITMVILANNYRQLLEIQEFLPSASPPVPDDQKYYVIGELLSYAPLAIGQLAAVMLPLVTWVWIRVRRPEPEHRGHRRLAVAAAGVLAIALWMTGRWAGEWIFELGVVCRLSTCPSSGAYLDPSFESLDRIRIVIMLAGVILGIAAVWFAVVQTRRGARLGSREWAVLLGLLAIAGAAKLWTADERRDTRAYIRWEGHGHSGFGRDLDVLAGPPLDSCIYDWAGDDVVFVNADAEWQSDEDLVWDVGRFEDCGEPAGILAIRAEPSVPIDRVAVVLRAANDEGRARLGALSLRSSVNSRETTGEFIQHHSCVVEFSLGHEGIPLDRFSTWGELAAAADAAGGDLVIDPTSPF